MHVVGITGKYTILQVVRGAAKQFCKVDDGRFRCLYYSLLKVNIYLSELLIY